MKKFVTAALAATAVTLAAVPATVFAAEAGETSQSVRAVTDEAALDVRAGQMLYSSEGRRIAAIYSVDGEGNAKVIYNGRMITVPAATLSAVNGKVTTSLTRKDVARAK
jgi:hypothetical protein